MPFASVNNAKLYYEVSGAGPQTLIFIHGLALDHRTWREQVAAFAPQYRVLTYDIRGFGQSSIPTDAPYSHADDLAALMDHLHIESAVMIGHSMGGRILGQMLVLHPHRARAAMFVCASIDGYQFPKSMTDSIYHAPREAYIKSGLAAAKATWLSAPFFVQMLQNPAATKSFKEMLNDYSGWHWKTDSPPVPSLTPPVLERLAEIKTPTLALVGALDSPVADDMATILSTRIPNAQKVIMPNTGHMPHMELPEEFNQILQKFLTTL